LQKIPFIKTERRRRRKTFYEKRKDKKFWDEVKIAALEKSRR
jgi:hypothetical protein